MDLTQYRGSQIEQLRASSLLGLTPLSGKIAIDIGARDGHFSRLLANRFEQVVALDLENPAIEHPRVQCLQGDAAQLPFSDGYADFIFCAEVLEHIPLPKLKMACHEIQRVANSKILIGVPYKQDIRLGRTTCYTCGAKNLPWGHVNTFDKNYLVRPEQRQKPA